MNPGKSHVVHVFVKHDNVKKDVDYLNCKNKLPGSEAQRACRCGDGGKKTESVMKVSCIDMPGKRRSTCPCYGSGTSCSEMCKCKGCDNSFGKKKVSEK